MNSIVKLFTGLFMTILFICPAQATAPRLISFQGQLTDSMGARLTGTYAMTFKLYNVASGGSALWMEAQSSVSVSGGVFDVELGSVTALTPQFDTQYWLGITVGSDAEMTPRRKLLSSPYALYADTAAFLAGSAQASGSFTVAETATFNGKVGIGTTSPAATLHVTGNSRFSDSVTVSDTVLVVNVQSGNVGIGVSNPSNKLTVDGKIRSTTGGFVFPDSTVQLTASIGASTATDSLSIGGAFSVKLNNSVGTFVVNSSGYVGIGVSNPTALLEIMCPVGFTSVKSGGHQLGCIQNDEQGIDTWYVAANTCFVNYGGRLPTVNEWYIAMNNYTLLNEIGNYELTSTGGGPTLTYMSAIGNTSLLDVTSYGTVITGNSYYRCWIPK